MYLEFDAAVRRVERYPSPPPDLPAASIHAGLLTPGLLNAHAHLNYSGPISLPRGPFAQWLEAMIRLRRSTSPPAPEEAHRHAQSALEAQCRDGVTEVWDIASTACGRAAMVAAHMPGISFCEIIHPAGELTAEQWDAALRRLDEHADACRAPLIAGLSPHAPYSVSPAMLERLSALAKHRGWPAAMHLAESPEELELLLRGTGPLQSVLAAAGADPARFLPRGSTAIELAQRADLLGPNLLAIHANLTSPQDIALLARTATPVVCCPLSHAWFAYPPWPLAECHKAGVRLALGTDSMASNTQLSIRAELRHVMDHWPAARNWQPEALLGLATGALLGEIPPFGRRGRLAVGYPARFCLWEPDASSQFSAEDALAFLLDAAHLPHTLTSPGRMC